VAALAAIVAGIYPILAYGKLNKGLQAQNLTVLRLFCKY